MSKRFTDSEKWKDPWFRKLPNEYKLLWLYILDMCDIAGLWKVDLELAGHMTIGDWSYFKRESSLKYFDKRIYVLGNEDSEKWLILKFCKFQYNKFSARSRPNLKVMNILKENKAYPIVKRFMMDRVSDRVCDRVSDRVCHTLKDKDKDLLIGPLTLTLKFLEEKSKAFKLSWNDYINMRISMRKKPTNRAKELLIKKLESLSTDEDEQIKILNQSIEHNWIGLFELKGTNHGKNKRRDQESDERYGKPEILQT